MTDCPTHSLPPTAVYVEPIEEDNVPIPAESCIGDNEDNSAEPINITDSIIITGGESTGTVASEDRKRGEDNGLSTIEVKVDEIIIEETENIKFLTLCYLMDDGKLMYISDADVQFLSFGTYVAIYLFVCLSCSTANRCLFE